MSGPGRSVTVSLLPTKRGWRIRVDASDGDTGAEAEVAARVLALIGQLAVDLSARTALLAEVRAAVEAIEHPCHEVCVPHDRPGEGYRIHADCQCAAWLREQTLAILDRLGEP